LSIGIENAKDIIWDINQALDKVEMLDNMVVPLEDYAVV